MEVRPDTSWRPRGRPVGDFARLLTRVLVFLRNGDQPCRLKDVELAEKLGVSPRTVARCLKALRDSHHINCQTARKGSGATWVNRRAIFHIKKRNSS